MSPKSAALNQSPQGRCPEPVEGGLPRRPLSLPGLTCAERSRSSRRESKQVRGLSRKTLMNRLDKINKTAGCSRTGAAISQQDADQGRRCGLYRCRRAGVTVSRRAPAARHPV